MYEIAPSIRSRIDTKHYSAVVSLKNDTLKCNKRFLGETGEDCGNSEKEVMRDGLAEVKTWLKSCSSDSNRFSARYNLKRVASEYTVVIGRLPD